ncbi:MAG: type III pantothenate kinase [Deltaproteobacteria bacterium]|nr:type III pantothenate kinase [Deltaproteobacteria bacterium]
MAILALDIGNTSTSFGLFSRKHWVKKWRCETREVLKFAAKPNKTLSNLDGIIISSVVPSLNTKISATLKKKFKIKPVFITHKNSGIKIGYPKPKEIGADRLADAVAAWERYKKACIIVDFGTATTLDYIDSSGFYRGGPIAPGIIVANEALYMSAAKLPRAKVRPTQKMIPSSTVQAMQSGIYQGYIGLVERLVKMTAEEVGGRPKIIATGGLSPLIKKGTGIFDAVDPLLTLKGLQIIWSKLNS